MRVGAIRFLVVAAAIALGAGWSAPAAAVTAPAPELKAGNVIVLQRELRIRRPHLRINSSLHHIEVLEVRPDGYLVESRTVELGVTPTREFSDVLVTAIDKVAMAYPTRMLLDKNLMPAKILNLKELVTHTRAALAKAAANSSNPYVGFDARNYDIYLESYLKMEPQNAARTYEYQTELWASMNGFDLPLDQTVVTQRPLYGVYLGVPLVLETETTLVSDRDGTGIVYTYQVASGEELNARYLAFSKKLNTEFPGIGALAKDLVEQGLVLESEQRIEVDLKTGLTKAARQETRIMFKGYTDYSAILRIKVLEIR